MTELLAVVAIVLTAWNTLVTARNTRKTQENSTALDVNTRAVVGEGVPS